MTMSAREAFERGTEMFNAHDLDGFAAIIADDAVVEAPGGMHGEGKAACAGFYGMWLSAFPDAHVEIQAVHVAGDVVVEEGRFTGTHKETLHTPNGDIDPTGRSVDVGYIQVLRFRDGMTVAFHLSFDRLAMLEQLGVSPVPATAA